MKIIRANKKGIELAVQYLRQGRAVVYPTDTAYGLGVDATNVRAVKKLFKIKERSRKEPIHVIVSNFSAAKKLAIVPLEAAKIMKRFWPGGLTVVLDLSPALSPPARPAGGRLGRGVKMLSAGTGTIGIRLPDNKIALSLVKKLGRPITTPSANPHGGPTPYSVRESLAQFRNKKHQPDLYLDAGKLRKVKPSTIVRVKDGKIEILRKGPITLKKIKKFITPSYSPLS